MNKHKHTETNVRSHAHTLLTQHCPHSPAKQVTTDVTTVPIVSSTDAQVQNLQQEIFYLLQLLQNVL
ncbi:hypothetical protein T10_8924, partial [Trichinella papuae]